MGPFLADRWWLNHDYKRDAIHWFKPLFAGAERHQESQAYYKYTGHSSFMTAFLVVQLNISCALSPPHVTFQCWAIILSPVLSWITYFFLGWAIGQHRVITCDRITYLFPKSFWSSEHQHHTSFWRFNSIGAHPCQSRPYFSPMPSGVGKDKWKVVRIQITVNLLLCKTQAPVNFMRLQ